ncbi:hypothetical protein BDL97_05G094000 [Sphagnum fallax]|nr:hypothetical protein BDL97_05G094000 [Sphagnum fallax]KAH8962301.1 hypothetical protein BDL97_05G094000 [Sphagnum fallax]KAH8962302.1 hypothetical protein BDL97_05G094000 [Sphagnum fallax]
MSLALVQGYTSEEDESRLPADSYSSEEEEEVEAIPVQSPKPWLPPDVSAARTSLLPSATHIFSEVAGPPDFLKCHATDPIPTRPPRQRSASSFTESVAKYVPKESQEQRPTSTGAVLEAKPLLVNDSNKPLEESVHRNPSVGLPPPDEAASLLRMCLQCGVPKTYSGVKESMVCPLCGDRPVTVPIPTEKKRGSKVKDKEHSKRMKGQSTHSSWKSETEMHLRQQFD